MCVVYSEMWENLLKWESVNEKWEKFGLYANMGEQRQWLRLQ